MTGRGEAIGGPAGSRAGGDRDDVAGRVDQAASVRAAVAAVTDPEYPGVTILDLGILEAVRVEPGAGGALRAEIDLIPTVLGCPALATIESDVTAAARRAGCADVSVRLLTQPWTPERIRPAARRALADELTVAIRRRDGSLTCPVCGSAAVEQRSAFGPTLCRELWWCAECRNPVEVLRR